MYSPRIHAVRRFFLCGRTVIVSSGLPGVDLQGPAEMKILLGGLAGEAAWMTPWISPKSKVDQITAFWRFQKGNLNV